MTHCSKCQAENEDSAKFCVKCGAELHDNNADEATSQPAATAAHATTAEAANSASAATTTTTTTTTNEVTNHNTAAPAPAPADTAKVATQCPNFFAFIIAVMMKPVTALKEEISKYSDFRNAAIVTVISAAFGMLCNLLISMISAVVVKRCSFFSGGCKTSLEWDNLGDLDWLNLTLVSFIAYALVIALLAGVFFGMSRAFKQKQTNFCRMMTVFAVALIPMSLALFVGGLIALFNGTIGTLVISAGSLYGFFVFYEGINSEAGITGNKKVYYNFLSIFAIMLVVVILTLILNESGIELDAGSKMLDFSLF